MHIVIVMLSTHGFVIEEVQDSNSEGMELRFDCLVKYIQVSSCGLREDGSRPTTVQMMRAQCEKVDTFPPKFQHTWLTRCRFGYWCKLGR